MQSNSSEPNNESIVLAHSEFLRKKLNTPIEKHSDRIETLAHDLAYGVREDLWTPEFLITPLTGDRESWSCIGPTNYSSRLTFYLSNFWNYEHPQVTFLEDNFLRYISKSGKTRHYRLSEKAKNLLISTPNQNQKQVSIFISYRRKDSSHKVDHIADQIGKHFGKENIFLDVGSIPTGVDFAEYLSSQIQLYSVILVVIGPEWESIMIERANTLNDYVRMEIELGLKFNKPLLPILIDDTQLPNYDKLPESIRSLSRIQPAKIRRVPDFENDIEKLIKDIHKVLGMENSAKKLIDDTSNNLNLNNLSNNDFEEHILDLLENGNQIAIRRHIQRIVLTISPKIPTYPQTEIDIENFKIYATPILDHLMVISLVAINYTQKEFFDESIESFHQLFLDAYQLSAIDDQLPSSSIWLWEMIITRIYILGAVLIKKQEYDWIPSLIRKELPHTLSDYYKRFFWSQYALMILARSDSKKPAWCSLATFYYEANSSFLRKYLDEEAAKIFVCQIDFLQCVHEYVEGNDPYPSFYAFYNHRTEPIISKVIKGEVKDAIPPIQSHKLADLIKQLDNTAGRKAFLGSGWRRNSWSDPVIVNYLRAYSE